MAREPRNGLIRSTAAVAWQEHGAAHSEATPWSRTAFWNGPAKSPLGWTTCTRGRQRASFTATSKATTSWYGAVHVRAQYTGLRAALTAPPSCSGGGRSVWWWVGTALQVTKSLELKITDFGLSRELGDVTALTTVGTFAVSALCAQCIGAAAHVWTLA